MIGDHELSNCVNIDNNNLTNDLTNNLTNNIANNLTNNIKILIPAKIKLRGEEIGGAFRSIIYDKLKKIHDKKDNNFGYVKSIDPNIEIDEGVLVKDSLLSEISFDVKAYAEVINLLLGEVTAITEINIINNSHAVEAKYYGMTVHIWNFDKDIKIEGKIFYMPSGKLKIGSTADVEVIKKTTTNSRLVIDGKLLYIYII